IKSDNKIGAAPDGTVLQATGKTKSQGGYQWDQVNLGHGKTGWVANNWLAQVKAPPTAGLDRFMTNSPGSYSPASPHKSPLTTILPPKTVSLGGKSPRSNPNILNTAIQVAKQKNWDEQCLGFVIQTQKQATGQATPGLTQFPNGSPTWSAKDAFASLQSRGQIRTDFGNMPTGAAVFWPGDSQWGHVAIFTGNYAGSNKTNPIFYTTTGWGGMSGARYMSETQLGAGAPSGWIPL
ncbi:MAG: SH3 domain-containing protein, partial [Methylacidiphilaceae bacterium]|nr:SH3 domain-containing protein [Candidatus Methylacidiphilaceae bacterium]